MKKISSIIKRIILFAMGLLLLVLFINLLSQNDNQTEDKVSFKDSIALLRSEISPISDEYVIRKCSSELSYQYGNNKRDAPSRMVLCEVSLLDKKSSLTFVAFNNSFEISKESELSDEVINAISTKNFNINLEEAIDFDQLNSIVQANKPAETVRIIFEIGESTWLFHKDQLVWMITYFAHSEKSGQEAVKTLFIDASSGIVMN